MKKERENSCSYAHIRFQISFSSGFYFFLNIDSSSSSLTKVTKFIINDRALTLSSSSFYYHHHLYLNKSTSGGCDNVVLALIKLLWSHESLMSKIEEPQCVLSLTKCNSNTISIFILSWLYYSLFSIGVNVKFSSETLLLMLALVKPISLIVVATKMRVKIRGNKNWLKREELFGEEIVFCSHKLELRS